MKIGESLFLADMFSNEDVSSLHINRNSLYEVYIYLLFDWLKFHAYFWNFKSL